GDRRSTQHNRISVCNGRKSNDSCPRRIIERETGNAGAHEIGQDVFAACNLLEHGTGAIRPGHGCKCVEPLPAFVTMEAYESAISIIAVWGGRVVTGKLPIEYFGV